MRLSYAVFGAVAGFASLCQAASVGENKNLEISIYNNNLALVKDVRGVALQQGENKVVFEGVAAQIKPESVLFAGEGIKVREYNYDYDLLTSENIIEKSVGKMVKTVIENPTTGENIFDKAQIVSVNNGVPVLKFSYGIETQFNGRLVFENLPESLYNKPTLTADVISVSAGVRELMLAYLTGGISWKTNYVAKAGSDNMLDLNGWVAIDNRSGIDYKQADVKLIAGDVNQVYDTGARPVFTNRVMAKAMVADAAVMESAGAAPQQISGYQLYTLPNKTDIKDNQTKQVILIEKNKVKYGKEGRLYSSLYFGGNYQSSFEKEHPSMYYIMHNTEEDNLGLPLPAGVVRFYENDNSGNMQFIGENSIGHVAKGEKIELNLGSLFNVFVNGKVVKIDKVSEKKSADAANGCSKLEIVRNYDAEVSFNNGGKTAEKIRFNQSINQNSKIISENIKGNSKDVNNYEWVIDLPADSDVKLTFTVQTTSDERVCR